MPDFPISLLKLPTPQGKSPETRVGSASDLRQLLVEYTNNDRGRASQRALVRGNLDGNAPYGARRRKGLEWTANVNFMGAKARLRAAMQPYHALFTGVSYYYECKTAYRKNDPDNQSWSDKITARFHEMIKTWKGFTWNRQHLIKEMLTEGWAPVIFDRDGDWRYRAIRAASVKVPPRSPSAVDERLPALLLSFEYRAHELWEKIANEDAATKVGWNVPAVKWAIRNSAKDSRLKTAPWEEWQRRLQHHDLYLSEKECDVIHCTHGLIQEFAKPGEKQAVSHFVITDVDMNAPSEAENGFLFSSPRRFKSYDEFAIVFFLDIGDGDWASVRGMAFDSFKHDVLNNRLLCQAANNAFLDSSLIFEAGSQKERDQQVLTVLGPTVFLPPGAKLNQTRIAGGLESVINASRFFMNDLAQNLGVFNQRTVAPEYAGGEKPTAFQISQQTQKEGSLTQDQVSLFLLTDDCLGDQMFHRAADPATVDREAKAFQRACLEDGVPKEALQQMEYVRANRLAGYGSAQMRQLVAKELLSVAPMMPEDGKNNLLEDFIAGTSQNPSLITRYNPPQPKLTTDDSLIVLENSAIEALEQPVIVSGQRHVNHLIGHLQNAANNLTPVRDALDNGQMDPAALENAYRYLQVMGPHLEGHLEPVRRDPSRAQLAKQFQQQIESLTAFHGKLRQAIRNARRQQQLAAMEQQNANALGALDEAKLRSAAISDQIKVDKAKNDIALKQVKAIGSMKLDTASTLHEMQMNRMTQRNGADHDRS